MTALRRSEPPPGAVAADPTYEVDGVFGSTGRGATLAEAQAGEYERADVVNVFEADATPTISRLRAGLDRLRYGGYDWDVDRVQDFRSKRGGVRMRIFAKRLGVSP